MKSNKLLYLSLIFIIAGFTGLFITSYYSYRSSNVNFRSKNLMQQMMKGMMGGSSQKSKYSSNGERIYYTATSNSGKPISAQMGMMKMSSSMMACVDCHGKDGRGGEVKMPMGSFKVHNITYKELTEEEKFTDEDIKKAITKGIKPDGEELKFPMPKWSMSEEDLNDLIDYLKTL